MTAKTKPEKTNTTKLEIIFIGGMGRSGSTLVDLALGTASNAMSVGELRYIWKQGYLDNQLCGCGQAFHDCTFWSEVSRVAWQTPLTQTELNEIIGLQDGVDKAAYIPQLLGLYKTKTFKKRWQRYSERLLSLYKAIAAVSGKNILIDSSKHISQGFLLGSLKDLNLTSLHLVRDARAVAFSWLKEVKRPEIHWQIEHMPRYSLLHSALEWSAANLLTELQKVSSKRYLRYHYEDLVAEPERLQELARTLNLGSLALKGTTLDLKTSHTVAGNPMRFQQGELIIKPDSAWLKQMPNAQVAKVTLLSAPLLLRYGYPLSKKEPKKVTEVLRHTH